MCVFGLLLIDLVFDPMTLTFCQLTALAKVNSHAEFGFNSIKSLRFISLKSAMADRHTNRHSQTLKITGKLPTFVFSRYISKIQLRNSTTHIVFERLLHTWHVGEDVVEGGDIGNDGLLIWVRYVNIWTKK